MLFTRALKIHGSKLTQRDKRPLWQKLQHKKTLKVKISHTHGLTEFMLWKWLYYWKQYPGNLYQNISDILQRMKGNNSYGNQERIYTVKAILSTMNNTEGITIHDLKLYYIGGQGDESMGKSTCFARLTTWVWIPGTQVNANIVCPLTSTPWRIITVEKR